MPVTLVLLKNFRKSLLVPKKISAKNTKLAEVGSLVSFRGSERLFCFFGGGLKVSSASKFRSSSC